MVSWPQARGQTSARGSLQTPEGAQWCPPLTQGGSLGWFQLQQERLKFDVRTSFRTKRLEAQEGLAAEDGHGVSGWL